MNKKILNFNLLFTTVIFMSVLFISIGYSALNSELAISGEAKVEILTDIKVTNVTMHSAENGAFLTYNPDFTNTTSEMSVTLPNANSKITLIIEVTNRTADYYHLDQINEFINSNSDINYEILNKEVIYFSPNSVTEIEVTFSYNTYSETNQDKILNLGYVFEKITYKNLDYIIYSGYEYIDTGLSNTGDYIFETEFNQTGRVSNDGGWIISGRTTSTYTLGVFIGINGVFNGYGGTTYARSPHIPMNSWHTLYFSRTKHTIDTYNYSVSGGKLIPSAYETTIRIGGATAAYSSTAQDTRHFIGYLKNVKITDAVTGEIIKYYVPAEIIEGPNVGEVGYWDVINDEFCANDGTGAFLAP